MQWQKYHNRGTRRQSTLYFLVLPHGPKNEDEETQQGFDLVRSRDLALPKAMRYRAGMREKGASCFVEERR